MNQPDEKKEREKQKAKFKEEQNNPFKGEEGQERPCVWIVCEFCWKKRRNQLQLTNPCPAHLTDHHKVKILLQERMRRKKREMWQ